MHSREAGSDNAQVGSPAQGSQALDSTGPGSILTVEDDDPAIAPTGLGVVTGSAGPPSVLRFLGQHSEALGHGG